MNYEDISKKDLKICDYYLFLREEELNKQKEHFIKIKHFKELTSLAEKEIDEKFTKDNFASLTKKLIYKKLKIADSVNAIEYKTIKSLKNQKQITSLSKKIKSYDKKINKRIDYLIENKLTELTKIDLSGICEKFYSALLIIQELEAEINISKRKMLNINNKIKSKNCF